MRIKTNVKISFSVLLLLSMFGAFTSYILLFILFGRSLCRYYLIFCISFADIWSMYIIIVHCVLAKLAPIERSFLLIRVSTALSLHIPSIGLASEDHSIYSNDTHTHTREIYQENWYFFHMLSNRFPCLAFSLLMLMFYLPPFFIAFVSMPTALYKNENFVLLSFCVELISICFFWLLDKILWPIFLVYSSTLWYN